MGVELLLPSGVALTVGEAPAGVGRGPMNAAVFAHDSVSWQHAVVWVEGDNGWVRDLGSRNGTFVNGQRIAGSVRLADGDELRFGTSVVAKVRGGAPATWRPRLVEDVGSGLRVPVRGDRFVVGGGPACDLRVEGLPARAATLVFHGNGEIWVGPEGGGDEEFPVEPNREFAVAGRALRVVEEVVERAATVDASPRPWAYALTVNPNAAGGPFAALRDGATGRELGLTGNRAVLLYALARQRARDQEAALPGAEQGWCRTEDVLTAIWGRSAKDPNPLNVLVHRLRGHLVEEGFDPWFIEKRRGAIRLGLTDVRVG